MGPPARGAKPPEGRAAGGSFPRQISRANGAPSGAEAGEGGGGARQRGAGRPPKRAPEPWGRPGAWQPAPAPAVRSPGSGGIPAHLHAGKVVVGGLDEQGAGHSGREGWAARLTGAEAALGRQACGGSEGRACGGASGLRVAGGVQGCVGGLWRWGCERGGKGRGPCRECGLRGAPQRSAKHPSLCSSPCTGGTPPRPQQSPLPPASRSEGRGGRLRLSRVRPKTMAPPRRHGLACHRAAASS